LKKRKVVILGGGVGGLSAGWMLARTGQYEITVIEKASVTGGACGTFEHEGFLLDYGPHKFYSVIPGIVDELKELMGEEFLRHEKKNSIFMFNSFLEYPIRMTDLIFKMGFKNMAECGLNALATFFKKEKGGSTLQSYETYLVNRFGRRLYELVFEPLADKVWGDPSTLSSDIASTRIPAKSFLDVFLKIIGIRAETELTDAKYFYYPRRGFGRIAERMEEEIISRGGQIYTNAKGIRIKNTDLNISEVQFKVNDYLKKVNCDLLISTIPIDSLVTLLEAENEYFRNDVKRLGSNLQYRTALLVYVFLNQETVTNQHWIFFPGRDVIFSRIFEQKKMSEEMCAQNKTVLCCDFTDNEEGILCNQSDEQLSRKCISDLEKVGIIKKSWVEGSLIKRLPRLYPRYNLSYKSTIHGFYDLLKKYENLLLTGRIGFYNYNNSDHCIDMGRFIATKLENGSKPDMIWTELEQRVANYKIVD
jgi:protoporphyrinogen oxidase